MKQENQYTTDTHPEQGKNDTSSFRLISTLGIAGFFSGVLLVTVYLITLPYIEAYRAKALQEAIYNVLPGCESYETLQWTGQQWEVFVPDEETESKEEPGAAIENVYAGFDGNKKFAGIAVNTQIAGFQDQIAGIFGYNPISRKIIGFEVLESKETPGLGDKIIKDKSFRSNFIALDIDPEVVFVKKGAKTNPNEIEGITGATISSRAVAKMIQESLKKWDESLVDFAKQQKN